MTASFPRYVPDHLVEPVMVQQKSSARLSTKGLPLPFDSSEKMLCMSCLFSAAPICMPPHYRLGQMPRACLVEFHAGSYNKRAMSGDATSLSRGIRRQCANAHCFDSALIATGQ